MTTRPKHQQRKSPRTRTAKKPKHMIHIIAPAFALSRALIHPQYGPRPNGSILVVGPKYGTFYAYISKERGLTDVANAATFPDMLRTQFTQARGNADRTSKRSIMAMAEELGLPAPSKEMKRRDKQRALSALIDAKNRAALEALFAFPTPHKQAARIMARFGGPAALAEALQQLPNPKHHRERTVVYKWLYPRERGGADGLIPHQAIAAIALAARMQGIFLTAEDWAL